MLITEERDVNSLQFDELINEIVSQTETLREDIIKAKGGNKSAAQRARVTTLSLEKLFKAFRKRSTKEIK